MRIKLNSGFMGLSPAGVCEAEFIWIQVSQIVYMTPAAIEGSTQLKLSDGSAIVVEHTIDDILAMVGEPL